MVSDLRLQSVNGPVLVLPLGGGPDLVHLPKDVRVFLSEIGSLMVAETILVAVRLAGNAFRYGKPPVVLGLQFVADHRRLRIEVYDHRPFSFGSWPDGYSDVVPPNRFPCTQGRESSRNGATTTWVEIAVVP